MPSLSIGISGLANVGKSTLFNALVGGSKADVSNYPFCTIEPNVGIVEVPDIRLDELQKILKVAKKIPAPIKFVDIAGLVKGAHKGEGLGNQFLAHIRETDVIILVLRTFTDSEIATPLKTINPEEEFETIKTELILKDLETLDNRLKGLTKQIKAGDKLANQQIEILNKIRKILDQNKLGQDAGLPGKEIRLISDLNLLTLKPLLVVLNCDEKDLKNPPFIKQLPEERQIEISTKTEAELAEFSAQEQKDFLKSLGLEEPGLNRLIRACFHLLDLISFYTFTPDLVQAWPIPKNTSAVKAAAIVHTDFAKKFIKAEVLSFENLKNVGSFAAAKTKGLMLTEGKDYQISDGDIVKFVI